MNRAAIRIAMKWLAAKSKKKVEIDPKPRLGPEIMDMKSRGGRHKDKKKREEGRKRKHKKDWD